MSEEVKKNSVEENGQENTEDINKEDGIVHVSEEAPGSSDEKEEEASNEENSSEDDEKEEAEEKEKTSSEPEKIITSKPKRKPPKSKYSKEYLPDFPYDFKTVLLFLFAISLIVFIWSVMFNPSMRIERIEINGNYEFSDDVIMDELDIHPGDHILKPTFMRAMELAGSTPYIDDIDVHIDFPSGLVIDVTERHRLAYIRVPDGYAVIDDEGVILDFSTFDAGDVHPVLCGLDLDSVVIGQRTDITESLKFRKMILVLGAVLDADRGSIRNDGYHFYDSVREIRVVSSGLIFLTVELPDGTVLQVKLAGVENIDENMQWLLYAIRADAFEGLPAGSLDMTEEEKIYRAYSS